MKIVLSAHMDLARPVMSIKMDDKNLLGLVDNFAGVFASYQLPEKRVYRFILQITKNLITTALTR